MGQRYTLLIVDDEVSNLQKLRRTFVEDCRILQARTGDQALRLLQRETVDAIITDQRMPGMSGVELLRRSLDFCPESRRIILTGYSETDYLMDAINEGQVHRYIIKPWEPFALRQTVLEDLEHFRLKKAHQLVEEQLRIAREVQAHLFPQDLPPVSGLSYSGSCRSAGQIGGDFFDFLKLSEREFCIAVGDVSGKGISAALLMANLQGLLRSHISYRRDSLDLMLREINGLLCSFTGGSRFATFFCAVYDAQEERVSYVNAGHNPPVLLRRRDSGPPRLCQLPATGVPLGLFRQSSYAEESIDFQPGDSLIVYTDGVVEAENSLGDQFGEQRLEAALVGAADLAADRIQAALLQEVSEFVESRPPTDDLTLVVLKRQQAAAPISDEES